MGEQNHAHNLNRLYLLSYYGYDPVPPLDLTPDNPKDRKTSKRVQSTSFDRPGGTGYFF